MTIKNVDCRKLTEEQQEEMIRKHIEAGWQFDGEWQFSIHQFIKFVWPYDSEAPKM